MESGTTQVVVSLTTIGMHDDNITALYTHGYLAGTATTPGNKVGTNSTILLTKEPRKI